MQNQHQVIPQHLRIQFHTLFHKKKKTTCITRHKPSSLFKLTQFFKPPHSHEIKSTLMFKKKTKKKTSKYYN